jgi:hypothetical protein
VVFFGLRPLSYQISNENPLGLYSEERFDDLYRRLFQSDEWEFPNDKEGMHV